MIKSLGELLQLHEDYDFEAKAATTSQDAENGSGHCKTFWLCNIIPEDFR